MSMLDRDISTLLEGGYVNRNKTLDINLCNPISSLIITSEHPHHIGRVQGWNLFNLANAKLIIQVDSNINEDGFEVYVIENGMWYLLNTAGFNEIVYDLVNRVQGYDVSVFLERIKYLEMMLDPNATSFSNYSNYLTLVETIFIQKVKHPLKKACECNYRGREVLEIPIKTLPLISVFAHNRGAKVGIIAKFSFNNGNYSVPVYDHGYKPVTPCREILGFLKSGVWDMEQAIKYLYWGYLHDNNIPFGNLFDIKDIVKHLPNFKHPSSELTELVTKYISEGSLRCTRTKPLKEVKLTKAQKDLITRLYSGTTPHLKDKSV